MARRSVKILFDAASWSGTTDRLPDHENLLEKTARITNATIARPRGRAARLTLALFRHIACGAAALCIFYLSLVATSQPLPAEERETVDRAIAILDNKGFSTETFLLRHAATIRSGDNWLNGLFAGESSFASTNFPFEFITVTPDFFDKTRDDLERAMILLHEAQHLQGRSDAYAYAYVWNERQRLGWTQLTYGTSETYVSVELQTREYAPELFTCSANVWHDCTETLRAKR